MVITTSCSSVKVCCHAEIGSVFRHCHRKVGQYLTGGIVGGLERLLGHVPALAVVQIADGILPDCAIENQQGFSEEEVEQLEVYLMEHADELMEKAKEMSKLTNLL